MITLESINHIRTSRSIKGFRSCRHATGVSRAHVERARIDFEEERLDGREARRVWLDKQWKEHFEYVAGPLRMLPPSARSRQTKAR